MKEKTENIEFIEEKKDKKEHRKGSVKDILDGSILTNDWVVRQLPYIVFLVILAFIYIGNRYHAEKIVRTNITMQKEINDLRAEAITTSAELMFISKQSEVIKRIKKNGLDLEESVVPPKKIIIK
ncbi:MAG: hypothetical protein A2X13_07140 [Bacteroidetes bacterium GWC2_33_15]|nr:MAG: hypothetical protein A2X10_11565 [Bacteroidetes bacterium GWA2_33_15]OFX51250.1 MAG: hypothetical protein A2X13_07140 [Bacteroidetes bacterium GWC2_33_15]OFX66360.1 MAG: hypothetical protein A2X15_00195 [Bacteroidetes bacterium GWB2_32_14]OFX70653.1 MAG: hypothetical protein A2X14_10880 [Bacteroidetes bacterium GWD2_33_33]HAN18757.1 hypothetical protein [Bacteroidales bacterium]